MQLIRLLEKEDSKGVWRQRLEEKYRGIGKKNPDDLTENSLHFLNGNNTTNILNIFSSPQDLPGDR